MIGVAMAGRPPHQPIESERRQVEAMASYGVPEDDIARVVRISAATLRKYYWYELKTGHIKANTLVAQNLFQKATGNGPGSVAAAIFWLKARAGWREVPDDRVLAPQKYEPATDGLETLLNNRDAEWDGDKAKAN